MKLYHGTKKQYKNLEPKQAINLNPNKVPEDELLNVIYFTSDYGRAVAMGSRPKGNTNIDDKNHKVTFEHPELFNPDENVYIYSFDSKEINEGKLKLGENGLDYIVDNISEKIKPEIKKIKAREVLNFYELTNWKEGDEKKKIWNMFKLK